MRMPARSEPTTSSTPPLLGALDPGPLDRDPLEPPLQLPLDRDPLEPPLDRDPLEPPLEPPLDRDGPE
jgi:hypothetical protein